MDYQKLYNQIIKRANSQNRNRKNYYYESHHIQPKCMGGNNDKINLVLLTAKEHFICHKLLCKIYPNEKKLAHAYWAMCNQKKEGRTYKVSSRDYEEAKYLHSKIMKKFKHSEETIQIIRNTHKDKPKSKEHRAKQSKIMTGRTYSKEINKSKGRSGNENGFYGKKHTEETKQKNRYAHTGNITSVETKLKLSIANLSRPKIKCKKCGREIGGGIGNFKKHKCTI